MPISPEIKQLLIQNLRDKDREAALLQQQRIWGNLTGQPAAITTQGSYGQPGRTDVNWGGILGNAFGTYKQLSANKDIEESANTRNQAMIDALDRMGLFGGEQMDVPEQPPITIEATAPTTNPGRRGWNNQYGDIIREASQTYGVPEDLLVNTIGAESSFNPNAVSGAGAEGLMQLMPGTARDLGVTDRKDPRQNIMGGANYISQLLKRYDGDKVKAMAAYNAGMRNVDKYGGVPPFPETQQYLAKLGLTTDEQVPVAAASAPLGRTQQPAQRGTSREDLFALGLMGVDNNLLGLLDPDEQEAQSLDQMLARAVQNNDQAAIDRIVELKKKMMTGRVGGGRETDVSRLEDSAIRAATEAKGAPLTATEEYEVRMGANKTGLSKADTAYDKKLKDATESRVKADAAVNTVDEFIGVVDELLDPANKEAREWATGSTSWTSAVPWATRGKDYALNFEQLKAKLAKEGLGRMRESGAPGTITEKEWPLMIKQLSAVERSMTEDEFVKNLEELKATQLRIKEQVSTWRDSIKDPERVSAVNNLLIDLGIDPSGDPTNPDNW